MRYDIGLSTVGQRPIPAAIPSSKYESEAELEKTMIQMLCTVGYEFSDISDGVGIMNNLRLRMEELNDTKFSDSEWNLICNDYLLRDNDTPVVSKTQRFQTNHRYSFKRDDGTLFNFKIIDKDDLGKNKLQVIHQYVAEDGKHVNRYDVSILCNGLPVVHTELKRRGVDLREAFNQIRRYGRESFWSGNRLFEYVQIFVISNGTLTKYYSNTTRYNSIDIRQGTLDPKVVTTCNSFDFTSFWTDDENNHIADLLDFSRSFLAKDAILKILTRYCVFDTQKQLLVMRPYQIAASEAIISKALSSVENGIRSCTEAGGFIWHTTGSGKTLTSFKTAQLMEDLPEFDKIIFVVDRKDLDYQSMKEFQRFQEGAVNGTTNTRALKTVFDDDTKKIVVTTIQKLSRFIKSYKSHKVYKQRVVIIFDECHRSQFGQMHHDITDTFKDYHLFGFTGTPIFPENAVAHVTVDSYIPAQTTKDIFGKCLHKYTIVSAIRDENVLRFKVDYVSTIKMKAEMTDELVEDVTTDHLMNPTRLNNVADYILNNLATKTHRHVTYRLGDRMVNGFNSLFAVGSKEMAIRYYDILKKKAAERNMDLRIATIFTYDANQDFDDAIPGDDDDVPVGSVDIKEGLKRAVDDYNVMFGDVKKFSVDGDGFGNYYKDVSEKMKKRELDLLIVVDMFLTGFDSKALNTLWVDRNFKYHGLIQAFSRTNRILNKVKDHGNIVCFRKMKKRVDEAIALFCDDKSVEASIIIKPFDDYYNGYTQPGGKYSPGFVDMVNDLRAKYPLDMFRLDTEDDLYDFVRLFGSVLRRYNLLMSYDDFTEDKRLLDPIDIQNYKSYYLEANETVKRLRMRDKVDIRDDIVFEMELMYQDTLSISYILNLIKSRDWGHSDDREFKADIQKRIGGDIRLRSKISLIMAFVNRVSDNAAGDIDWADFVKKRMDTELTRIITDNRLDDEKTRQFVSNAFKMDQIRFDGMEFNGILPPIPRFDPGANRAEKVTKVEEELSEYFEMYHDVFE